VSLKKLQRLLQPKRHVQIGLYLWLSVLTAIYSMMIKLYKIAKLNFRLLSTNGFHVKAKAEKFTAASSRCRQNVKHENFTSSKHYTKSLLLVQQDCFSSLNQSNQCYVIVSFAVAVAVAVVISLVSLY